MSISNGRVMYDRARVSVNGGWPVDTVASFSCNSGYSRSGSSSRTCQTSGNWNQQNPTCNQNKGGKEEIYFDLHKTEIPLILDSNFFL